ncbi:MAG: Uncharacterised protein [Flavobacteriia bacterium]|nr:MAG: Uncharacterised protein [Flavobacteriia bacterium]
MGQHGTADHIPNGVDVGLGRLQMGIDRNAAALVGFQTCLFQAQLVGERPAANGHQASVARPFHHISLLVFGFDCYFIAIAGHLIHLMGGKELHAQFLHRLHELFAHAAVHAWDDPICILHHAHLRTEAGIDRAEFKSDHATANDDHVGRHFL